jgi:HlyD family secretion protein
MYARQKTLYKQNAITKVELEQRELALENSRNNYQSALSNYQTLQRQLSYNSEQAKRNLLISEELTDDYTIKSDIGGKIYGIYRKKGELVGPQTPIAVVGNDARFVLEMQVDEYDIIRIRKGQKVIVTMDSYKDRSFEAVVSKINPMMNERTKSFTVEARFIKQPKILYPNFSFEANIVLRTKKNALLIPRKLLRYDNTVELSNGTRVKVKTGLKDYQQVEILSGIKPTDLLMTPEE